MRAGEHFFGSAFDGRGFVGGQISHFAIDPRRDALDQGQRADKSSRKAQTADGKILHRARRLGSIKSIRGHAHFPHGVMLDAKRLSHARLLH